MFNPERLLGGLLRSGMRRGNSGGLGSIVTSGAALGLVGVAWEAVEHYLNQSPTASAPTGPPPMTPPAGLGGWSGARSAPPPSPPGGATAAPPLPPKTTTPPASPLADGRQSDAILLIQAMIAAANADGTIDAQERTAILDKLKAVQLSPEEQQFIVHELLEPTPMQTIVAAVTSPDLARQVYLVSLLAITVDTDEEIDYLQQLAQGLKLNSDAIRELHQQAGVEVVF